MDRAENDDLKIKGGGEGGRRKKDRAEPSQPLGQKDHKEMDVKKKKKKKHVYKRTVRRSAQRRT